MTEPTIRVLCVTAQRLVHEGIVRVVEAAPGLRVLGVLGTSGEDAVELYRQLGPDVTILDLPHLGRGGVSAIRAIRRLDPGARIVVLAAHIDDERIDSALDAGAMGCLVKDTAFRDLVPAIRAAQHQQPFIPDEINARLAARCARFALSRREMEVLELIADGKENRDISGHLRISYQTVRVHVRAILLKLGVSNRTHAVSEAVRRGILDLAH